MKRATYSREERRRIERKLRQERRPYPDDRRAPFLRPSSFIWVGVCLAIGGFVFVVGLPALRWQYAYNQNIAGGRYYVSCDYISIHNGGERVRPANGRCPLIALRRFK